MKNNNAILVYDIGTQSIRATIFDSLGNKLASLNYVYDVPYLSPKKGDYEQDINYYVDKMCYLSKKIKEEHQNALDQISGVVIVDIRDSSVILDENKNPIRNAILWLDEKRIILNGKNFNLIQKIIFKLIGKWTTVVKNSERTPCQWLKENEKDNYSKMKYYAPIGAYFNYALTNNLVVSSADCIGHFPMNFKTGKYHNKLHPMNAVFGIPLNKLVPLVSPGSIIGKITKEFSLKSGIKEGIPLYASGSDKANETLGNGSIDPTTCSISLGTASTIDVCYQKYKEPYKFLPSYLAPYKGDYHLELQVYSGFWLVSWFIKEFVTEKEKEEAKKENITIEEFLDRKMDQIEPGNDGLVLQPYFYPALERPEAKGMIVNYSFEHNKYNLYRAIIEGIVYALKAGLEQIIKKTHVKPKVIFVSGGGAKSDIICQLIADVFNIKVKINNESEVASLGGAISGFLANKTYSTPSEAIKKMVKYNKEFIPNLDRHKKYEYVYKNIYLKMYKKTKKLSKYAKDYKLKYSK